MSYLSAGSDLVEPVRMEVGPLGWRAWVNGKPESGAFTWDELRAVFTNDDELRTILFRGQIAVIVDGVTIEYCGR